MDINIDYIGQKYLGCFLIDINTSYVWLEKTLCTDTPKDNRGSC